MKSDGVGDRPLPRTYAEIVETGAGWCTEEELQRLYDAWLDAETTLQKVRTELATCRHELGEVYASNH